MTHASGRRAASAYGSRRRRRSVAGAWPPRSASGACSLRAQRCAAARAARGGRAGSRDRVADRAGRACRGRAHRIAHRAPAGVGGRSGRGGSPRSLRGPPRAHRRERRRARAHPRRGRRAPRTQPAKRPDRRGRASASDGLRHSNRRTPPGCARPSRNRERDRRAAAHACPGRPASAPSGWARTTAIAGRKRARASRRVGRLLLVPSASVTGVETDARFAQRSGSERRAGPARHVRLGRACASRRADRHGPSTSSRRFAGRGDARRGQWSRLVHSWRAAYARQGRHRWCRTATERGSSG
jgi:hypothetical protein